MMISAAKMANENHERQAALQEEFVEFVDRTSNRPVFYLTKSMEKEVLNDFRIYSQISD